MEAAETLAPGSPTEGYARCLAPATDVRQLKHFLKTRQWFGVKEQRAAAQSRSGARGGAEVPRQCGDRG